MMVKCILEVKSMAPAFSVPSVEVMGWARKNYLEPSYPRKRYDEQRTFSDGRFRDRVRRGDKSLERALDSFQEHAALHSRYLQFNIEEEANLVQVIVKESNDEEKIIRKIPPDEIVRLIERRNEILGFLFDIVA
jgi:flagellar protein FlaG